MELVYVWIKQYKNIYNQGLNFSNRCSCSYNMEENTLSIKIKENFLENFFGNKINITAIVGENGVGKSSVLEILSNKKGFSTTMDIFFIHFDKETNNLEFSGAEVNKSSSMNINEVVSGEDLSLRLISKIKPLQDTKTVYFSNILNENDLSVPEYFVDTSYTSIVNISTSQILSQMKLIETKSQGSFGYSKTGFDKIFRSYRSQQIQNAIILIKDNAVKIPFNLPKNIIIRNVDFKSFIDSAKNKFKDDAFQRILSIIERNNTTQTIFKNYLSTNIVISLLLENANDNNPILEELLEIVLNEKMSSSLDEFYDNVRSSLYEYEFLDRFSQPESKDKRFTMPQLDEFLKLADKLLKAVDKLEGNQTDRYYLELNIKNTDLSFLKLYEKLIQQSEYFWDINWSGISSGEENYMYQFSRLYQLRNGFKNSSYLNLKVDDKVANKLILLIDEGEVTLHPQWQKNYISYLIDFLEKNFTQNIHLILTTHSPFILSDIPNDNIIFLTKYKKEDDEVQKLRQSIGNSKVQIEGIESKTFGANIHTLLADGFFMHEGLIGEVAKEKITKIMNYLSKQSSSIDMSMEQIKLVIENIGEELLKNKLEHMYNEFNNIGTNETRYLNRIAELEALLKEKNDSDSN